MTDFVVAYLVQAYGTPGLVPKHFNASGQIDAWMAREETAQIILAMTMVGSVLAWFMSWAGRAAKPKEAGLASTQMLVIFSIVIFALAMQAL